MVYRYIEANGPWKGHSNAKVNSTMALVESLDVAALVRANLELGASVHLAKRR